MTVATLKSVLDLAMNDNTAIAGLVVLGYEDVVSFVAAAEVLNRPVILQAGPGCRKHMPVPVLAKMFRYAAERASVPVVCHIDHATTFDECLEGVEHGFTSVMIDGSSLPLNENIDLTARVVEAAHKAGVSVEGEVGQVGYLDGKASSFTSPQDAQRFERETRIDALAISVGNLHLNTEQTTSVDEHTLRLIEAATTAPLVLHGGSGIPVVQRLHLAQNSRVKKFNIGTELRMAFGAALRDTLHQNPNEFDRNRILQATMPASKAAAMCAIESLTK